PMASGVTLASAIVVRTSSTAEMTTPPPLSHPAPRPADDSDASIVKQVPGPGVPIDADPQVRPRPASTSAPSPSVPETSAAGTEPSLVRSCDPPCGEPQRPEQQRPEPQPGRAVEAAQPPTAQAEPVVLQRVGDDLAVSPPVNASTLVPDDTMHPRQTAGLD